MERKTLQIIVEISIIAFFLLLVGLLIYSIFYAKGVSCNERLELKKVTNCSEECRNTCIQKGFNTNLNNTLLGEKISVYDSNGRTVKESTCLCECPGCTNQ